MIEYSRTLYTVGHSNHSIEYFVDLLKFANINCIVDVRSTPASKYNPQYNLEPLKAYLNKQDIVYMHFGEEFGARHKNPELWDDDGIVDFAKVQKTRIFNDGIERVDIGLSKGYRIALMCSEGNPLECHRFSMVSSYLIEDGFEVKHILKNKAIVDHDFLIQKLEKKYKKKIQKPDLFQTEISFEEIKNQIYRLHNKEIGWSVSSSKTVKTFSND